MAARIKKIFSYIFKNGNDNNGIQTNTDWKSIYIATLVSLLASIQNYTVAPVLWLYIKFLHPTIPETANGAFGGASALGNAIASTIAGILVNKFSTTKPQLIAAKILTMIAALFFFGVELNPSAAVVLLIIFQLIIGVAGGFGSVYRTHLSMATEESERSKAFGIALLATAIGSIIGPLSQILFSLINYPGLSLLFGIHFNSFTAPIFLTFLTSIIGALLLFFFFNGKLHVPTTTTKNSKNLKKPKKSSNSNDDDEIKLTRYERLTSTSDSSASISTISISGEVDAENNINEDKNDEIIIKYDKIAVIILIFTKVTQDINLLVLLSIAMPYAMTVFEWSSEDMILFQSIMMAPMGICALAFSFCYIRLQLDKKVPERFAIIVGMGIFFLFYFMTFPWWFLPQTIPYAHKIGAPAYFTQDEAITALATTLNQTTNGGGAELVGCNVKYAWCSSTSRINIIVFVLFAVLSIGFGMPLSNINIDILYSKVLGPIKQGVLQGIMASAGQVINIFGPILVTIIYTISGPFWLWLFELIVTAICIISCIIFYPRLISYTLRVEKEIERRKKSQNVL